MHGSPYTFSVKPKWRTRLFSGFSRRASPLKRCVFAHVAPRGHSTVYVGVPKRCEGFVAIWLLAREEFVINRLQQPAFGVVSYPDPSAVLYISGEPRSIWNGGWVWVRDYLRRASTAMANRYNDIPTMAFQWWRFHNINSGRYHYAGTMHASSPCFWDGESNAIYIPGTIYTRRSSQTTVCFAKS